jgi:cytochrome P450
LGCQPGVDGYSGPLGLAFFVRIYSAAKKGRRLQLHGSLFQQYGVYTLKQHIPGRDILFTIEPENVKAILATQFNDFGMGHRLEMFDPLLGDGIFNADGHKWSHARTLLRPQFTRDQVSLQQ